MSFDPMFLAVMKAATDPANCKDAKEQQMMKNYYESLMKQEPKRSPYIYYKDGNSTVSGSASTPTHSGRCVVCGKPSNLKCSPCASYGTQWMYFCGKDHQKLIWPLHKRVCGKTSTPWSWPPLTKKEVEEMIELTTVPCRGEDGEVTTWAQRLALNLKARFSNLTELVDSDSFYEHLARTLNAKLKPSEGSPLHAIEVPGLIDYRSSAWVVSGTSGKYIEREPTFEETLDMVVQQPFNFLAHFESNRIDQQDAINGDNRAFWSDLQHHLVILLSFICLAWQRGTRSIEYIRMEAYRQHAYDETMKYCREVIKPIDPEMAQKLAWNLITPLFRDLSQMNSSSSCPTM